ncbi:class I SAM-dependent methyltransferase [Burkholderiaceae bacterium DAT-1]|nr:class I SAM-dependent methyltransferase [Burkholderiaceae bacterium DAT-1]
MDQPSVLGIAHWDQRFQADGFLFGEKPSQFVLKHAHHLPAGANVLAVADGDGRNGVWAARQGCTVDAVDGSAVAVAKARQFATGGPNYRADVANLLGWDWPDQAYDVVLAVFIQFVPETDMPRVFEAMKRAVKPGGVLMLHGYTPKQLEFGTGGPKVKEQLYTLGWLEQMFAGWDVLTRDTYEMHLEEGSAHAGMSALVDWIVRKPQV